MSDRAVKNQEIDWSKIPVDTKVYVRDNETQNWMLRYFSRYQPRGKYHFEVFHGGLSSSICGNSGKVGYRYCKLAEEQKE